MKRMADLHGADWSVNDRPSASLNVKWDPHACERGQNV